MKHMLRNVCYLRGHVVRFMTQTARSGALVGIGSWQDRCNRHARASLLVSLAKDLQRAMVGTGMAGVLSALRRMSFFSM